MLLVCSATIWFGVIAEVVSAYHTCEAIFPLECHHRPSAQARLILSRLIMNKVLRDIPKGHQAGASLLHMSKVFVDVMDHH